MTTDQRRVVWPVDDKVLTATTSSSDRLVLSPLFKPIAFPGLGGAPDPDSIDVLRLLLSSQIGYLFLDRTRITPDGFALGEHIQSLSLAPGEEVTLEQRTYSERQTSFEQQSEEERQFDIELSSTLTTELAEGMEWQESKTEQTGFRLGGSFGFSGGVDVKTDLSYSKDITEASNQTRNRSVKESSTLTSRLASRYRALHKTVLRVVATDRVESAARRVIRNPSPFVPIDLHYFKVLRRLSITQERYGVRLAWAVSVQDPAADVMLRLELSRNAVIERVLAGVSLPKRPTEPAAPNRPPQVTMSPRTEATKWGLSGDMRADYVLPVPIPSGYVWDGDVNLVGVLSVVEGRPPDNMGWNVVGTPVPNAAGDQLMVTIHVGARPWLGGPKIFMQAKARFIGAPADTDPAYRQAIERWRLDVARWEAEVASLQDVAKKAAEAEADELARQVLSSLDPAAELMDRIAKASFGGALSDEAWEVQFWSQVFEWDRAGVQIYPSWWSRGPARQPLSGPNDFINASWATLYLPIRPGREVLALRWILGKVMGKPLDAATETQIAQLVQQLKAFRLASFGEEAENPPPVEAVTEKFLVLGRWSEVLPTDGTHLEIVQGITSAVDSLTEVELTNGGQLRAASLAAQQAEAQMKKQAATRISNANTPIDYKVVIGTDQGETAE